MSIAELSAPFPADAIHWRAQAVRNKPDKPPVAMALAYIDARDVMARLDSVIGPENWQDSYTETASGRVLCTLSIRVGDEWVSKSDGAGSTDIEGDKGGLSDAFKRAAVKWGIGRYLYDMETPWAECELYNGKWSKWTQAGLAKLRKIAGAASPAAVAKSGTVTDAQRDILAALAEAAGVTLLTICETYGIKDLRDLPAEQFATVQKRLNLSIDKKITQKEKEAA